MPPTAQPPSSSELIFAPVGIAHLTRDNADLLRGAARGKQRLRITTAAQLNGTPHIGTVVTVLSVFAIAAHAREALDLPATVIFDALDNAPAEQIEIDGEIYTRTVGDLIDTGQLDRANRISGFERLLRWAAARSDVRYEFRPYSIYQGLPPVRTCLYTMASRLEDFRSIVAPSDGIVRIRPRCPECRLMEKSAKNLTISAGDGVVQLDSLCPVHGRYQEIIDISGSDGWYDANTPVRSIQKGFLLSAERELYEACSVSVDGADWGGAWHAHVLAPALTTLGIPAANWPVSMFTPLVLDRSGGKLSKTLYVRYGPAYADLPEAFLNLDVLLDQYGDGTFDAIWTEITRWAAEPRRLHRAYTVDYLADLIRASAHNAILNRHTA
ncbi:hypothetical protein [Streptoalloteichus hindustanus]|uniref:Uncharacterized protein n=1 Tax=Streptoalloteichus hindustanus TaxID=2017 RepID=A0A1M5MRR1_STRHI|nr:hypothetical protein [Streptoalloteichus hindustanus]SHG79752.1 hypothetical protein SAMN05444320_11416 [Streptoalloteichus hindustanus]